MSFVTYHKVYFELYSPDKNTQKHKLQVLVGPYYFKDIVQNLKSSEEDKLYFNASKISKQLFA